MLASKIRKTYLTPKEINILVNNSNLTSITPFLEKVLRKSRNRKINPLNLLELQWEIAIKIISYEKQIRMFKKSANRKTRNNEWLSLEIYKAHRRTLKGVMDGIAFRFLNFNRPILRQLIAHNQTGFLTNGFLVELKKAEYIVRKTGFYVILNDLTNFLRYGDLTIISHEGVMIDEVKTKGSSKGNQKKALDGLIKRLNKKTLKIGDQTAQYVKIKGKPINFFSQVEKIINKSKSISGGVYAKKVSPYLWVSSIYRPKIEKYWKSTGNFPNLPKSPFNIKDIYSSFNSLIFFDQVSPNIAPFSIFPFSEKIICEIMTGQIHLKAIVSKKELVKSFRGKGWSLTLPPRKAFITAYDSNDINKIKEFITNPKYFATLKKGKFNYRIPHETLLSINSEFYSVKSIVNKSENLMKVPLNERVLKMVATGFSEEHLIWK